VSWFLPSGAIVTSKWDTVDGHWCVIGTTFLRTGALARSRRIRFPPVVSLGGVGLATHKVPSEASVFLHEYLCIQNLPGAMVALTSVR
jgi:hypothetical protein